MLKTVGLKCCDNGDDDCYGDALGLRPKMTLEGRFGSESYVDAGTGNWMWGKWGF